MAIMRDLAKDFVEFFDCEYEYFPNNTYEEIMEKFEKYSKEGKEKGYFPVIVTVDETLFAVSYTHLTLPTNSRV